MGLKKYRQLEKSHTFCYTKKVIKKGGSIFMNNISNLDARINIRTRKATRDQMAQEAKKSGKSLSKFIDNLLIQYLEKQKELGQNNG